MLVSTETRILDIVERNLISIPATKTTILGRGFYYFFFFYVFPAKLARYRKLHYDRLFSFLPLLIEQTRVKQIPKKWEYFENYTTSNIIVFDERKTVSVYIFSIIEKTIRKYRKTTNSMHQLDKICYQIPPLKFLGVLFFVENKKITHRNKTRLKIIL